MVRIYLKQSNRVSANRVLIIFVVALFVLLLQGNDLIINPIFFVQEARSTNLSVGALLVNKCSLSPITSVEELYLKLGKPTYKCSKLVPFGNNDFFKLGVWMPDALSEDEGYGRKWVCMDKESAIDRGDCHVYSFGINNEWSFDDAIARYGCKVYSFDPTMGVDDHQRSANVVFYNLGLSNTTGTIKLVDKMCKVARLLDIRKKLGHDSLKIDFLKIDIESSELEMMEDIWTTSPGILTDYVSQIGLEVHLGLDKMYDKYWRLAQQLECLGFDLARSSMLRYNTPWPGVIELVYMNKRLLFSGIKH